MAVEYDLVVIGASLEGIFAAGIAASYNARVALVDLPLSGDLSATETIYCRTFSIVNDLVQKLNNGARVGIYRAIDLDLQLDRVIFLAEEILDNLAEENSLASLAAAGVDVVSGAGEFARLPSLAFIVGKRRLRSRRYLIATGSVCTGKHLEVISQVGYLNSSDLWQKDNLASLPDNLAIIGGNPLALDLAGDLAKLGKQVSFIIEGDRLLSQEDKEATGFIQAQLEAEGVKIFIDSPITQVKSIDNKIWLQAGDRAIETDRIIFAGKTSPNIAGLNLAGVGVKIGTSGIKLDRRLQTTNSRIYGCGDVAGGYPFPHLARYEATIAVKNALFFGRLRVDYRFIPRTIFNLARVGMTEEAARSLYGKDVTVVRQYFKTIAAAQITGETSGFCKLILKGRRGTILGAHIVGPKSEELIAAIALAMKHKINFDAIANYYPFASHSEILDLTLWEWQRQNRSRHNSFFTSFFSWRRNWFS